MVTKHYLLNFQHHFQYGSDFTLTCQWNLLHKNLVKYNIQSNERIVVNWEYNGNSLFDIKGLGEGNYNLTVHSIVFDQTSPVSRIVFVLVGQVFLFFYKIMRALSHTLDLLIFIDIY